uniref:Kazal-like domain-containing protein n=1 Tax=Gopherus agassizii TaxID=38772 RepID=A0A452GL06_9SAUR
FQLFSRVSMVLIYLWALQGPHVTQRMYQKPPSVCTKDPHPVCGTDNKTYANKCFFCKAAWEKLGSLCFKQEGEC